MNTEQLTQQIDKAANSVAASQLPEEYKLVAFKVVLSNLLSQLPGAKAADKSADGSLTTDEVGGEDWQMKIASKLKVTAEQVAAIYHREGDGSLRLILDTSVLPPNKQTATQDIARLLAAGRVAAGMDEAGSLASIIRAEAEYYGRLDAANFTRALHGVKPNFHYDVKEKILTPRAPGFAEAAAVVKKYCGEKV